MAESFDPNEPIWPDYERDWEAWTLLVEQFPDGHLDDKTGTFFRFKLECIRGDEWIAGFGTDTMKYAAGGSSIREVFINLAHKIAELDIDVKPPFWEES